MAVEGLKLRGRQPKPMFWWITDVSNVSLTAYNEWRYVERFKEKAEEYGIESEYKCPYYGSENVTKRGIQRTNECLRSKNLTVAVESVKNARTGRRGVHRLHAITEKTPDSGDYHNSLRTPIHNLV